MPRKSPLTGKTQVVEPPEPTNNGHTPPAIPATPTRSDWSAIYAKGRLQPITKVPAATKATKGTTFRLSTTLEGLGRDQAYFIPAGKDVDLNTMVKRVSSTVHNAKCRTRVDRSRNGVWIFRKDAELPEMAG